MPKAPPLTNKEKLAETLSQKIKTVKGGKAPPKPKSTTPKLSPEEILATELVHMADQEGLTPRETVRLAQLDPKVYTSNVISIANAMIQDYMNKLQERVKKYNARASQNAALEQSSLASN